ncbi:13s globulin basic chain [Quercus suber]|uniref:13s globulin basic chain n=1 Tax=Quercus suber TaxID=58331 RepID=A0AAW0J9S8_QUESU
MRGNNVRAAEVDMDVDARSASKRRDNKREKKSESKRGNDVKAYEVDVDVEDAFCAPHWNWNAHSVVYVLRGRAQVQVVDDFGQPVFDDELQQDQILTVPQNFAVVKRASSEGFEWVAFKTNDRAQISPLAGRASVLRAIPADVLANAFQLSQEDVSELKVNMERQGNTLIRPSRSSSQRRAIA